MKNKYLIKVVGTLTTIVFIMFSLSPLFVEGAGTKHWAQIYLDELSKNNGVEEVFKDKDLNAVITVEDFQCLVKVVLDEKYNGRPDSINREAVVHELTRIWAEKTGQDLDKIPVIRMLIYSDAEEIEPEYNHSIIVAYMRNIAKGKGARVFAPKAEVSYGELATLVYNTEIAIKKELKFNEQSAEKGSFETKGSYEIKDDKVVFNFELINHYTAEKQLQLGSGQQFEVIITNEDGEEVYRYSDGKVFTMALVYKNIKPGESLKWQDEWALTNKEGKKASSGKYTAEIRILANSIGYDEEIAKSQLTTMIDFNIKGQTKKDIKELPEGENIQVEEELTEESIFNPEVAKEIIKETADQVIFAISNKDSKTIAEYIHPVKGVRFTPYTYVSLEQDIVFNKEEMKNFFINENSFSWGYYDGIGSEIRLTPAEYYEEFIYSEDFINAEEIGYNEVLSSGNMLENQFEVYENAIIVEYYFPGFNPDYAGMGWKSLRLVFEEYEDSWKLVGIIHNQWTI